MLFEGQRSDIIKGSRVYEGRMCMGIAEAAHESAAPTLDDKGTSQCLGCKFAANSDDTLSFDEDITSVRWCASGIEDIDVNECNDRIVTARSDFHTRNFQAGVCLGLIEQSVGYFIDQLSYVY